MYKVKKINFGWYRRKHGILLENLPPSKQNLLLEHDFMKWLESDPQTFEIIFKIEDMHEHEKNPNKILWNPFRETFTTIKEVEEDSNVIDWICAICPAKIKTRMDSKKIENFVCKKCAESHNSRNKIVDQRIIDSSIKFTKHCKTLLKGEQKEFLSYVKKSANR
jgi:hypothetical protein